MDTRNDTANTTKLSFSVRISEIPVQSVLAIASEDALANAPFEVGYSRHLGVISQVGGY